MQFTKSFAVSRCRTVAAMFVLATILALAAAGCGPKPVRGGTAGRLTAGTQALSEVQVNVWRREGDGWLPIGFAETTSDGAFELVANGAAGPLELAAGEYRFTLESVGAPVKIPSEFAKAETTPLQITWPSATERIDLVIPQALTPR